MAIYIGEHKYEDNHGEDGMEQQGPDSPQPNTVKSNHLKNKPPATLIILGDIPLNLR